MKFVDLGLIDYTVAAQAQLDAVASVSSGEAERVFFCQHPSIVTLGRGAATADLQGWDGPITQTSRGGKATFHGPSQIIIYPILNLKKDRELFRSGDLHGYLRTLENLTCNALAAIGVPEVTTKTSESKEQSFTGVWTRNKKIASIGIAVKKWVSYHGIAINVEHDPNAFRGINPCGFQSSVMTSVEEAIGEPRREQLTDHLKQQFEKL